MRGVQGSASLGPYQPLVKAALAELHHNRIMARIWKKDYTVWKDSPVEIANRLGWLKSPQVMTEAVSRINNLVDEVRGDGYTQALLLGMGGSSLAPEVFRKTFGVRDSYLDLAILDSTDPGAVQTHAGRLDPAKTLFVVSTKSGGTVETFSFLKYFYNHVEKILGASEAGRHFIAITDPGSTLADLATEHRFRKTFLNDPDIGGRYSALSYFGLVPAALIGMDIETLLCRAAVMAEREAACEKPNINNLNGASLGAVLGEMTRAGRDKVTFVISPGIASFGDWLEQLLAESTGKEGKGILPIVGEPLGNQDVYGNDRLFILLHLDGDEAVGSDGRLAAIEKAGHPVVRIHLPDRYDLGAQCFLWEMATAVAGHLLGVNPFDQPDVKASKALTKKMIAEYTQKGQLPVEAPVLSGNGIAVYGDVQAESPAAALAAFLRLAGPGTYVAIQAYLQPTAGTDEALSLLRTQLRDKFRLATTVGYGPRFLHSTGQLHKGDNGRGLFIQITADDPQDVPIPDELDKPDSSITFGILKAAQTLGDRQALINAGRRLICFHLGRDVAGSLKTLAEAL
ncbi:MAG: hypothetical protein QMD03_05785 [Syntrophales bacterium]|nr:hypothetical protein [Syntrophales bacterium]